MRGLSKKTIIILSIIALLVVARLCLPYVAKYYINRTLQNDIEGYTGSIEDVDIHLYRGAYAIDNLKLLKKEGKVPIPFIAIGKIDFSLEWQALFDGAVVGEITLINPELNFVDGPSEEQSQTGEEGNWQETANKLFPLRINKFVIQNGEIHFRNFHTSPKIDIFINDLDLVARNLTNSEKIAKTLLASIDGEGKILGSGNMEMHLDMNPLQEQPPFNLDFSLEGVDLVKLNDFFKAYAKIDVEKGQFALFSELTGDNGKFKGYIKPLFKDVKVLDVHSDKNKPLKMVWEATVGFINTLFKNHRHDQLATKIPVSGDISDPEANIWVTIIKILENGFVKAINPELDGTVELGSLPSTEKELKKEAREEKKEARKEKREERKKERQKRREEKKENREEQQEQ